MHLPAAAVRLSRECCIGKQAEKVTPCPPAVDLLCLSVLLAQAPLAPACSCQANHWPGGPQRLDGFCQDRQLG